jgi:hypothetical protein
VKQWKGPYQIKSIIDDTGYVIKPISRNGRSKQVNQKHLKKCFNHKVISSGCNDVQLLLEKGPRGRPRKQVTEIQAESNSIANVSENETAVLVEPPILNNEPETPVQTEASPVQENTEIDNGLRKSTRIRRQPDRYSNSK